MGVPEGDATRGGDRRDIVRVAGYGSKVAQSLLGAAWQ